MATTTTLRGKREQTTTPRGIARFPSLNRPTTRFHSDGEYQVDLVLPSDSPDLESFRSELEAYAERSREEIGQKAAKADISLPIRVVEDADGNETGDSFIRTRMKAMVRPSDGSPPIKRRILFVDSKRKAIEPPPVIGRGSELVVACDMESSLVRGTLYVSLRPRVVQVIKLVAPGQAWVEDYGLQDIEEEEAFSADEWSQSENEENPGDEEIEF